MTRALVAVVVAGCSSPAAVSHPQSATSPLSQAADAQMIVVPAGKYIAGSTPEERQAAYDDFSASAGSDTAREHHWFDGEDDRHVVTVMPAFHIDLMPVTQGEFAEFVASGGAPAPVIDEDGWKKQGLAQSYAQVMRFIWKDGSPPSGRADHPVVLVTWDEANRYCQWRGQQVGAPRRLPTEGEYEKAARGDNGIYYPWGNAFEGDKLDSAVAGPGDTMPVGSFVKGASPYGMLDAAGNVFEWTATPYKKGQMTVKGSSWEDFAGVGRGASRHGRPPELRHAIIGFRCAADG